MEGRCAVETWADFGLSGTWCTPKLTCSSGTEVFLCPGSDEVYVFSTTARKLTVVLQFPGPVSDLVECHATHLLYVACKSGVYCVSLQSMLSRARCSPADASSSPAQLKISSDDLVVPEEGVCSLLLVGSALLTLSQRGTSWTLTLYKPPKRSVSSSCETLTSFSLPLVSGAVDSNTEGRTRKPVLICVHCSDTTPSSSSSIPSPEASVTHGHLCLQSLLFKLLFGIDAALVKSPVVLCGLPDGRLCFLPLRVPESRLRVLHSLEQPVVFVGASRGVETGPGRAECLVAVGELGRVVLMETDQGGPEGGGNTAAFIERRVPGPVTCGCVDQHCLYYSTGSDLLRLDLSEGSSGRERPEETSTSRRTDAALQSPTSLNVCGVIALAEPTCDSAGGVQLLGLSLRGQLQRITLPVGREDANLSKVPSAQAGRTVGDFLSAIGDVCERASRLKAAVKSKNQILTRLNHVLNVSFLLMAGTNAEEHRRVQEKPIRCRAMTQWSRLLQKDSLNLTCVLDNSSPYALERGWTLSLAVFPLSYSPDVGGDSSSTNFSFPFHDLRPGGTFEVSLPLAAAGDAPFPVTVCCSLVLSLSSLLGEEAARLRGSQGGCISLPLNTLTVDWLHALQVIGPADAHKKDAARGDAATRSVRAFLSSRHVRCGGRGEAGRGGASQPEREPCSARVRVSLELLRHTLTSRSSGLDRLGTVVAPEDVCRSLLGWLLSEGPGGVRTGHQGDSSPVVHARGPDSHPVKLTATQVNLGEESPGKEESLTTVEVQVESSSMAAVCGLHHAVLRRVQALLQRPPKKAASTKTVQSLSLRRALQRAEHLLQQIQQSRVSEAFGGGASSGRTSQSLLAVYRELRENPVVII